jgi:hypothetical protein
MRRIAVAAVVLTALAVTPAAHAWTWPGDGPVLRPFVLGDDPYAGGQHRGVDIGAEVGAAVLAPAAGTVSFVGSVPGGGRAITIQTADGYAVTLLQLGTTDVARGEDVTEAAIVGAVGQSADAVTTAPHVHLGVRVATDPNGYVDPLGLLPARPVVAALVAPPSASTSTAAPAPAAASTVPAESPPAETSAPNATPPEMAEVEAPAVSMVKTEASPVSNATVNPQAAAASAGPAAVRQEARTQPHATSEARRSTRASRPDMVETPRTSTAPAGIAKRVSPTPLAGHLPKRAVAPAARAKRSRPRLPEPVVVSEPIVRTVFDRFAVAAAPPVVDRSGGDSEGSLPVRLPVAAAALLILAAWLARGRNLGAEEAGEDARMMSGHDDTASPPEDPRGGRVAVCERPTAHRPCGGIRGPGGHLRALPPVARERRPHGQRDGRARHAGHGRRGSGRHLPA